LSCVACIVNIHNTDTDLAENDILINSQEQVTVKTKFEESLITSYELLLVHEPLDLGFDTCFCENLFSVAQEE